MRTSIYINQNKIDIYECLDVLVNSSEAQEYYRVSKAPGMAAWDCEITLSRFGALKDAEGLGYEYVTVFYEDEEDAADAFRRIKEKISDAGLFYFKMFYCLQSNAVTFIVNSLSDAGEEFGITKFIRLLDYVDSGL